MLPASHVTVVIPAKDEAGTIGEVVLKASRLGSVVVIDSHSTDGTEHFAREAGAKVVQFNWDGKYPKKRNWILRQNIIAARWVLFLDADEFITDDFVMEVRETLPETGHGGFWLNYDNFFLGRKLCGGDPFRKLALFRTGHGEYEKIPEVSWSDFDMEVHEHPVIEGSVGEIMSPIQHNDYRGLKHYIDRHNEYSEWEARRFLSLQRGDIESWNHLSKRQQRKYRNLPKWWLAPAYFLMSYIVKGGFKDGSSGFHFALMKAIYFYQIRLKITEHESKRGDE